MEDPRIATWNILHDGEITAASTVGDTTRIFVCIPYLRRRFAPLGDSFALTLRGISKCEFRHFDGEVTTLEAALEIGVPEILSTNSEELPVRIATSLGELVVECREVAYALDTGEAVTFGEILAASQEYWAGFAARGQKPHGA